MNIKHMLVATALAFGGAGSTWATTVDTQTLAASQQSSVNTIVGHEGGGSLDAGPAHDSSVSSHDTASSNSAVPGTGNPHPRAARRSLGWQSLLPGSIQ